MMLKTLYSYILEPYSDKDSIMEQELANCHAVHDDIATYKRGGDQATLYSVSTLHCEGVEVLKQVAYANYTLNELKVFAQVLGDFMFFEN